jgi:hypothetical protein
LGDPTARSGELLGQAERALRMARVLATGGFPEEALPLLAKAIGHAAAAKLSALGEPPAGVSVATPMQMRDLVERGVLPTPVLNVLAALWPSNAVSGAEVGHLLEATATILVACDERTGAESSSSGEPRAQRRFAA